MIASVFCMDGLYTVKKVHKGTIPDYGVNQDSQKGPNPAQCALYQVYEFFAVNYGIFNFSRHLGKLAMMWYMWHIIT